MTAWKNRHSVHPEKSGSGISNRQGSTPQTGEACADIIFGTPSKHCSGNGICMVIGRNLMKWDRKICTHVQASISLRKDGCLIFQFRKDDLPAEIDLCHLSQSIFTVEERFSVPLHLARHLGFSRSIWISAGLHTILETADAKALVLMPESGSLRYGTK